MASTVAPVDRIPAVVLLQETKLREDPSNAGSVGPFKGYKFLGHPRTTPVHKNKEVRGGGLATLVRVDIGAKELPVVHGPTDYPDDVTELQLVEVHVAGKTIRCLNVYRPPCEQSRGVSGDDRVPAMDPRTWPPDVDVVAGDVNLVATQEKHKEEKETERRLREGKTSSVLLLFLALKNQE